MEPYSLYESMSKRTYLVSQLITCICVFVCSEAPCVPTFAQLNADNGEMEPCTRVKSFDYFSGSEAAYILTLFFILGSVIRE